MKNIKEEILKEFDDKYPRMSWDDVIDYENSRNFISESIDQALFARDEEWREKIEDLKVKQVDGNWDNEPLKEGEEAIHCITCGAFYYEGGCLCRAVNEALDDLINSMK